MKYLQRRAFSSPANSRQFLDNWDAVFGEEAKEKGPESEDPEPYCWGCASGVPYRCGCGRSVETTSESQPASEESP